MGTAVWFNLRFEDDNGVDAECTERILYIFAGIFLLIMFALIGFTTRPEILRIRLVILGLTVLFGGIYATIRCISHRRTKGREANERIGSGGGFTPTRPPTMRRRVLERIIAPLRDAGAAKRRR